MKTYCITKGCKNAPLKDGLCALHRPEYTDGTEGASGVPTAAGGHPEAAVNDASEPKPKQCKALNRKGEPCRSTSLDATGLCAAHRGKSQFGTPEMSRKAAKASAESRRQRVEAREARVEESKLSLTDLLRVRALERREELVKALLDAAAAGRDVPALRMIFERLDGRPTEHIEVEAKEPSSLDEVRAMSPEERRAFIRRHTQEPEEQPMAAEG